MKWAHRIEISVFVKQEEDVIVVENVLRSMIPFSLDVENIVLKHQEVVGFFNKKIHILSVVLQKTKHTSAFLQHLMEKLSPDIHTCIIKQVESRLDERFSLYLRFDKTLLEKGLYSLTDGGDCFHVKIDLAVFPKKREKAIEIVRQLFSVF